MPEYCIYVDLFGNDREEIYYSNSIASATVLFEHFLRAGFKTISLHDDDDTLRKVKDGVEVNVGRRTRSC